MTSFTGDVCPSSWKHFQEFCYVVPNSTAPYAEARHACEDLDAEITSILNVEENDFLHDLWVLCYLLVQISA